MTLLSWPSTCTPRCIAPCAGIPTCNQHGAEGMEWIVLPFRFLVSELKGSYRALIKYAQITVAEAKVPRYLNSQTANYW